MEAYSIDNDGFGYQELDLEVDDFIEYFPEDIGDLEIHDFSQNNMALAEHWKLLRTGFSEIEGEENLMPDISRWISATLVLSPRAHRLLSDSLAPYGEFLPVLIGQETYQIFNCLTMADAGPLAASESEFVFDEQSVGDKLVFKTHHQSCLSVFCTERFKEAVSSFELKGVTFNKSLRLP